MSVVLNPQGQAIVTDKVTGEVHAWPVPTALENVARGDGRYCHGKSDERIEAPPEPAPVVEAPVELRQEGTLDLPSGEGLGMLAPIAAPVEVVEPAAPAIEAPPEPAPVVDPLDHDENGKKGGSKPGLRPKGRRAAVKK